MKSFNQFITEAEKSCWKGWVKRGTKMKGGRLVNNCVKERADTWHPDPEQDRKLGGPGANQRAREDAAERSKPKEDPKKLKPGESYMDYANRQSGGKPTPKPKEGVRDKIKRKLGDAIDRVAGLK